MSDVKELIKQRGHIKARVTLFEKYLKPLLECKEISLVQVNELRLRLSKIRDLSCTFDDIQSQIEMLDEDTSKQMQEREFNENIFFRLSAEAQSLIDFFENKNKLESSSNKSRPNCHLKLPPIKITPFNGEANKWLSFRDTYVSLVHNNETIDDVNRFHYLKTYLEGPASAVINSVSVSSDNYSLAWKLLCERYDNKRLLINEHIKCLFSIESLTKESHSGLRNLIDTLSKNLNALHILGELTDKWDTLIIFLASAKLDSVTSRKWEEYRSNKDAPTLDDFYDFLRKRSMVLETMNVNKPSKVDKRLSFSNTKSFLSSSIESPSPSAQCLLCKQNHKLYECNTFKSLPVSNRINKLKLLNQSFKIQEQSDNNSKNLPTLSPAATVATDSEVPSSSASVSMTAISTNQSLLSTALVKVTSNGKTCILRALLDCGSQSSFVTVRALRETGSQHFDSDYHSVSGIGSSVFNVTKHCYLDIGSLNSSLVMRVKCFVLPHITDRLPNVAVNVQHLDIPCHVQLADPKFFEPSDIDLLLGADVFWDLLESSRINLGPQGPILQETKLGWIVAGPTAIHSNSKNRKSFCHFSLDKASSFVNSGNSKRCLLMSSLLPMIIAKNYLKILLIEMLTVDFVFKFLLKNLLSAWHLDATCPIKLSFESLARLLSFVSYSMPLQRHLLVSRSMMYNISDL
ncbi:unnamed protein product [Danaus chrysippus]|uniref:(African queen) hypothetical protein n=1 Tax=Danaus chrysippus TaxID=151541 RepID=A0A8J2QSM3_9NEOP|nr:unnamed protein product [Danaus chrysippus]